MEFLDLRQIGSVEAYRIQFEQVVYHIRLYDSSISETMLVSQFIIGLKEDVRNAVEMQLPTTIQRAATLAQVQEQLLQRRKRGWNCSYSCQTSSSTSTTDGKHQFSSSELWKAKQLREYHRINLLCYKCGEKYTPSHKCTKVPTTPPAQLAAIVADIDDGGGILPDSLLDAIECSSHFPSIDDAYLSLNAITGSPKNRCVQLRALV